MTIREQAEEYAKQGLNVIPLIKGSKNPPMDWKKYQTEKFTDFDKFTEDSNIGVICGGISNNLVVADFEGQTWFDKFFTENEKKTLMAETRLARTGRTHGVHVYLFNDKPVRSLAVHNEDMQMDLQGEGRIIVMPPSKTEHPYVWLNDVRTIHKGHDYEQFYIERLATLGIKKSKSKKIKELGAVGSDAGNRHNDSLRLANYYIHILNMEPDSALAELKRWAALCNPPYEDFADIENVVKDAANWEPPTKGKAGKEDVIKITPLAGLWDENFKFEQILTTEGSYAFAYLNDGEIKIVEEIDNWVPVKRLFWRHVAGEPIKCTKESVWDDMMDFLYTHLDLKQEQHYTVIAAYIMATWCIEKWRAVPYIEFISEGPSTGKTRALECIEALGYRGMISPSFTQATTFRIMDSYHPILLFDEAAKFARQESELMDIVKSGYRRGTYVYRMSKDASGDMYPEAFDPFGFKGFGTLVELDAQLTTRCIRIPMQTAVRKVPPFIDDEWAKNIRSKLLYLRFMDLLVVDEDIAYPDLLNGRLIELYTPLMNVCPPDKLAELKYISMGQQTTQKKREQDTKTADIVRIITDIRKKGEMERKNQFSAQQVCDVLNVEWGYVPNQKGDLPKDAFKAPTIGKIITAMDFQFGDRLQNHQYYIMDDVNLSYLLRKYFPDDPLLTELSKSVEGNATLELPALQAKRGGLTTEQAIEAGKLKMKKQSEFKHKVNSMFVDNKMLAEIGLNVSAETGLTIETIFFKDDTLLSWITKKVRPDTLAIQVGGYIELFIDKIALHSTKIWRSLPEQMHTDEKQAHLLTTWTNITLVHELSHVFGFNEQQARNTFRFAMMPDRNEFKESVSR